MEVFLALQHDFIMGHCYQSYLINKALPYNSYILKLKLKKTANDF
jgi:hypothetical protein